MKRRLILAVLMLVFCGTLALKGYTQPLKDLGPFMRSKLKHSQNALEGIVMKDFQLIGKNAQAMSLLSLDASWQVIQSAEYFQRSIEFQRTALTLERMAREKNLDGAALSYIQLTTQCFDCHRYVRDFKSKGVLPLKKPEGKKEKSP